MRNETLSQILRKIYKMTNGPVNAHLRTGICNLSLPCRKLGQGHPRVMIYTKFVELYSLMLQAKFQNQRLSGSKEKDL